MVIITYVHVTGSIWRVSIRGAKKLLACRFAAVHEALNATELIKPSRAMLSVPDLSGKT